MSAWLWLAAAAAVSIAATAWWYGRREERVRGRGLAALLRGLALFFLLSAPWLPGLADSERSRPRAAILLDVSSSMRRPVRSGAADSRIDAARRATVELLGDRQVRIWSFGDRVEAIAGGAIDSVTPSAPESRVVEAIELARASGADTLYILTDGELSDREAARRLARRLGVHVREVRVAEKKQGLAIRALRAPRAVAAGDSLTAEAELTAVGRAGDTLRVRVALGEDSLDARALVAPADARIATARFRIPVSGAADTSEWRPLDVIVEASPSRIGPGASARSWVRVTPEPTGAVLISLDPDWESRFMAPVLDRSVPGGCRVFLQVGQGSWVEGGTRPTGGVSEARVRAAANAASMLVVQGDPAAVPPWLRSLAARSPAVMHLARGSGALAGTGLTVEGVLAGDWYAETPAPAGPVSAHLLGASAAGLPPFSVFRGVVGAGGTSVLEARLGRQGSTRPIVLLVTEGERRRAAVLAEGGWRWAARGGEGLSLYRGLYAGIARWLGERRADIPVELADRSPRAGDSLRWRAAPGVRDLHVRVEDASGTALWASETSGSVRSVSGPPLGAGDARFTAKGLSGDEPFQLEVPFYVGVSREDLPVVVGTPLDVYPADAERGRTPPGSDPPVWPFALSIALLCAEWLWRRRSGLR